MPPEPVRCGPMVSAKKKTNHAVIPTTPVEDRLDNKDMLKAETWRVSIALGKRASKALEDVAIRSPITPVTATNCRDVR
jgi:hypothetical protein